MKGDSTGSAGDPDAGAQWRAWALAQGIPVQHLAAAATAAIELGSTGASVAACVAAAWVAAGMEGAHQRAVLLQEVGFVDGMIAELGRAYVFPEVPSEELAAIERRLQVRSQALRRAGERTSAPTAVLPAAVAAPSSGLPAAPAGPVVPVAAPAAPPRPPRPPLGPSLRQFATEHSILLLSYAGAFLLIVAVVLFELYGVASLGATVRFAGVLGLDLVFAAAGWACLRSRRLRVVGHTYVAIAALQAPLVFIAAYVFFALQQKGISVDLALFITGTACTCLYAALALRLRSQAYGLLALLGLAVAGLGGVNLAEIGAWRGPGMGVLVSVYALIALRSSRIDGAGELFARHAGPFVHGAAVLSIGLTLYDTASLGHWPAWIVTGLLAVVAGGYLLAALAGAGGMAVAFALAAGGLGWAAAAHDLRIGDWTGPAVAAVVLLYALVALAPLRATRVGELAARQARFHMWGAAAIALVLVLSPGGEVVRTTGWPLAWTLGVLTLGFAALALLAADLQAALTARAAFGLAWAVAARTYWGGQWAGPATAALAFAYAAPAHRRLRTTPAGLLASRHADAYLYLAALVSVGLTAGYSKSIVELAAWPMAMTFALLAVALTAFAVFADRIAAAVTARVAFGAAWMLTVHDLGLGAWRGTADTVLVCLYALSGLPRLQLGRLGALLAARRAWLVHSSAALALALTAYDSRGASSTEWQLPATFGGLAFAYLLFAWLGGGPTGARLSVAMAGLAWITAVFALHLNDWTAVAVAPLAPAYLLLSVRARHLGGTGEQVGRAARPFIHGAVAVAILLAAALEVGDAVPPSDQWITWQAPIVLAVVAATYLGHWIFFRRPLALFAMATAASLAVLSAGQVLQQGPSGAAVELVVLAAAWAVGVPRSGDRLLRSLLRAGVAIQALLPLVVVADPSWLAAALLLSATAVFAGMAEIDRSPRWLLAAGPTFAGAWFWGGAAIFPDSATSFESLGWLFAPFPLVLGVAGIALRVTLGSRWALPAYLYAGIGVIGVELLFFMVPALAPAGRWLMADMVVLYAIAGVERRYQAAIVAAIGAFVAIALTLAAAGAAPIWYPVALGAISIAVYASQLPWERLRGRDSDWIAAHRYLGLGGAGMTAISGFALFDYTRPGTLGCALAGLAVLVFAGLIAVDGRRFGHVVWDYAAVFTASLATYFAARYFALANPEWYLAGPGLTLIAIGLRMPFDARLKPNHLLPQLAVAAGALLLLGVAAAQAVVDAGWTDTVLLVVEGAAALIAGIGFRSRVLVVAGGAAIGVAALRSLFVLVQHGLLFVAFGSVALTLLALGAALALLRDRFNDARSSFAEQWREWN